MAFPCNPSSSRTSRTVRPIRQLTGLPPVEEKKLPVAARDAAISRRVIDGPERMAVAHRLGDGDHVGHDALLLEAPEVAAETAVADLDLVGDAEAAVGPDGGVDLREVALGQEDPAGVPVDGLGDQRGGGRPPPPIR